MAGSKDSADEVSFGVLGEMLGYRLRRAQLTFFNNFSTACADLGVSPGLFGVLAIAKENPGLTQTAVAQALGNDRSAMVAAVDRLEKLNLIERRPSKRDRRSYALYLTDHGQAFYKELVDRVGAHEDKLCERLKPGEKEVLLEILGRFVS